MLINICFYAKTEVLERKRERKRKRIKMKMKYPHYEGTLEVVEIQIHLLILAHRPGDNRDHAVSSLPSVNEMIVSIISDEMITYF